MRFKGRAFAGFKDSVLNKSYFAILSEMSKAFTECVNAPMDIMSTPLSATARMVSLVMPPEAYSKALPSVIFTASAISSGDILSSIITSTSASIAS